MTQAEPRFAAAGGELIAGITGLSTVPMRPYVLHQIDLLTGKPVQMRAADETNPADTFTTRCFTRHEHITLSHFIPGGGTEHADLRGPGYIATGLNPREGYLRILRSRGRQPLRPAGGLRGRLRGPGTDDRAGGCLRLADHPVGRQPFLEQDGAAQAYRL